MSVNFKTLLTGLSVLTAAAFFSAQAASVADLDYTIDSGNITITNCDYLASGTLAIPAKILGKPVIAIGDLAFQNCDSLTSVTIPNGVTTIGEQAFQECDSLTSMTVPNGVTTISRGVFAQCDLLTSVTLPEGVTSIERLAFYECPSLTSVNIPEGVTSLDESAFKGCVALAEVTIPSSITTIGIETFSDCTTLSKVYFLGSAPSSVEADSFLNVSAGAKAIVYISHLASYGGTGDNWNGLTLEARADPVPSIRFTSPKKNATVGRKMVTRYRTTNIDWASLVEVQVRGGGKTKWLSFAEVKSQHLLIRKIKDRPGKRLVKTAEKARIRDISGSIVQVATLKLKSKFPWKSRKAKVKVLKAL